MLMPIVSALAIGGWKSACVSMSQWDARKVQVEQRSSFKRHEIGLGHQQSINMDIGHGLVVVAITRAPSVELVVTKIQI